MSSAIAAMTPTDRARSANDGILIGRPAYNTSSGVPDVTHLVENRGALVRGRVEVRADSDADAGPVVDDEPARDELVGDALRITGVDRHVPAALRRVGR